MLNPLDFKGNYRATLNNTKFVHWPLMVGLHLDFVQQGGGLNRAAARPGPLLAMPNVIAHPSMASVPITVALW